MRFVSDLRDQETDRETATGSLPRCLQQLWLGQVKVRRQEAIQTSSMRAEAQRHEKTTASEGVHWKMESRGKPVCKVRYPRQDSRIPTGS